MQKYFFQTKLFQSLVIPFKTFIFNNLIVFFSFRPGNTSGKNITGKSPTQPFYGATGFEIRKNIGSRKFWWGRLATSLPQAKTCLES